MLDEIINYKGKEIIKYIYLLKYITYYQIHGENNTQNLCN